MAKVDSLDSLQMVKGFKMVHLNVRSLPKKIDQIRLMMHDSNLDVLTFSETWLKSHLNTKIVELEGYKSFRPDRATGKHRTRSHTQKRGGGLLTYVHDKHAASSESLDMMNISNEHIEVQWIHIHRPECKDVVICNVYRPPTGELVKAINYLDDCLKLLIVVSQIFFIIGDMNVDYLNKKSPCFKKLDFFVRSNGLTHCISTTTRVTEKTKSLIDLVLTNSKFIKLTGTLEHHISDHQPIYIVHTKSRDKRQSAEFRGRSYRNFDKAVFQNRLTEIGWGDFYNLNDANESWEYLLTQINSILDKMCPIRTVHIKNYRPDWMTKDLIEQIKDRDYFYQKAKKTGDKDAWNIAKYFRNITNTNTRHAKREFILKELKHNENNPKKIWKTIKSVLPSDKEGQSDEIMLKNGDDKLERNAVAEYINDFFINVGKFDKSRATDNNAVCTDNALLEDLTLSLELRKGKYTK